MIGLIGARMGTARNPHSVLGVPATSARQGVDSIVPGGNLKPEPRCRILLDH
jgi:hypothetical protein